VKTNIGGHMKDSGYELKSSNEIYMADRKNINDSIGKEVISVDFGLGTITSIQKLDDILDDFFVIECMQSSLKNFISTRDKTGFRYVSSKDDLNNSFELLRNEYCLYFTSKKDRINFFKSSLSCESLDELIQIITEMSKLDDLSLTEKKIFSKILDSILLEISYVMEYGAEDSKHFLVSHLDIAI
jgi:RNA polymerase-interacting CarD/CdnL/TRCF family regulator